MTVEKQSGGEGSNNGVLGVGRAAKRNRRSVKEGQEGGVLCRAHPEIDRSPCIHRVVSKSMKYSTWVGQG